MFAKCNTLDLRVAASVLHVTLNRPEVRNALSIAMWHEISAVFSALEQDRSIRAVVLRGAAGYFCAGGDLKERAAIAAPVKGDDDPIWERNRMGGRILKQIDQAPQVVISVIEGAALGGGLGLVCVSDVALATAAARFGIPETSLGIPPAQLSPFITRRIGQAQARYLALTAASIDGTEAARIGLIHRACADLESLEASVTAVLERVGRCAPGALAATKQLIALTDTMPLDQHLDTAAGTFVAAVRGPEGIEGAAAFRDKRLPLWNDQK